MSTSPSPPTPAPAAVLKSQEDGLQAASARQPPDYHSLWLTSTGLPNLQSLLLWVPSLCFVSTPPPPPPCSLLPTGTRSFSKAQPEAPPSFNSPHPHPTTTSRPSVWAPGTSGATPLLTEPDGQCGGIPRWAPSGQTCTKHPDGRYLLLGHQQQSGFCHSPSFLPQAGTRTAVQVRTPKTVALAEAALASWVTIPLLLSGSQTLGAELEPLSVSHCLARWGNWPKRVNCATGDPVWCSSV